MNPIRIGPYELLDALGEGGMGRVYRARDTRLGRIVAIKFLQARSVADQRRQMRFLREAKAEAALSHPNLATLLDVGEAEVDDPAIAPPPEPGEEPFKVPYLVLEFVPGRDLRELAHQGQLPLGELLRIARQLASGLRAAHNAGVVHRDLKPANVRVTPDGLVKILDFGLARFVDGAAPTSDDMTELATSEGVVVGTVPYLAPEQAAGAPIDARADLFSLGVLLYELACGEVPFRGVSTVDRLRSVLQDHPPPLDQRAPAIPPRFAQLVHRLLAKEARDRPRDAAEVEAELEQMSREIAEAQTSTTLGPASVAAARSSHPSLVAVLGPRRSAKRWTILGLLAAAALTAAVLFFLDRRSLAEAKRLIERGREAEELPDAQAARIAAVAFEQAAKARPSYVPAWTALSTALVTAWEDENIPQLLKDAESAAERAYAIDPDSPEACIAKARIERWRGNPDRALELLAPLPKQGDFLYALENELAEDWNAKGDLAQAEKHYLAAIAARPDYWRGWNALGVFRLGSSNFIGAKSAFEKAESLAPKNVTLPAENAASALFVQGKYAEALAAYDRIRGPEMTSRAANNRGAAYYYVGRFEDAEQAFRAAIRIAPRRPDVHRNLADTLLKLDRPDEARQEYEEALRLVDELLTQSPSDVDLRLKRALYLARSGRCADATAYASQLEGELGASAAVAHGLARPFALCGSPVRALAELERAIDLGYPVGSLRTEDELAALRGNPKFEQLTHSGEN